MVLSSAFQPQKMGNATEVVGALRQDRYSGIMGELGPRRRSFRERCTCGRLAKRRRP